MLATNRRPQVLASSSGLGGADGGDGANAGALDWRPGRGVVVARSIDGRTVLPSARAESPLRWIRPTFPATKSAAVCMVTFGGGLVDGDAIDVDVDVGAGATLVMFSQSSTKIFRGAARQSLRANVEGTLVLLPDLVSPFCEAEYTQRVDVTLGREGSCVLLDGFTSGRAAFGERWAMRRLDLRTIVTTHDGRRVFVDALVLDEVDGPIVERVGRYDAIATLVAIGTSVGPVVDAIEREAFAPPSSELVVAASVVPSAQAVRLPGALVRVAAASPARAISAIRARLRNLPDIDAVDPFGSRY